MQWITTAITVLFLFPSLFCATGKQETPQPIEREHFIYYFSNPAYAPLADSILAMTRLTLKNMIRDTLDYKAKVYIVDNLDYFRTLIRGKFPDWGAGAAYPPRQLIAIKSPDKFNLGKSLSELLAHEYSHLVLAERTGFYRPPRWFDEGLAMLVSTEWNWFDNLKMNKAAVFGGTVTLRDIENVNRFDKSKAEVAYAESYLAVKYFYDEYGIKSVNTFLDEIAAGHSIDKALENSTGSNYKEFQQEFEQFLSKQYNIVTLWADTMYLWMALAIIVVIGAVLKYKKRRSYYKKWEEEEQYQSTDFDYGDPDNPEQIDDDEPWRG